MSEPILEARGISKSFNGQSVLRNVDLRVDRSQAVGLVGPNGAGKSTFLRCLLGLCHPDSGSVRLDGVDALADSVEARGRVGFLPGETSLYGGMTGQQQLAFGLGFHAGIDSRTKELCLDTFRLPLERKLRTYSGGMKQQLAVTIALSSGTPLYILDEPHKGLDASMRQDLRAILEELKSRGKSMLISSHQLNELEEIAAELEFLVCGENVQRDKVEAARCRLARSLRARFREEPDGLVLPSGTTMQRDGPTFVFERKDGAAMEEVIAAVLRFGPTRIEYGNASLQDLYEALYHERAGSIPHLGVER